MNEANLKAKLAKEASKQLSLSAHVQRNAFLQDLSKRLITSQEKILIANSLDIQENPLLNPGLVDRLKLNPQRIQTMASSCLDLIQFEDPVGRILEEKQRPNGLRISKVSVPLGTLAIIYEARPNVTIEAATLAIKSGNTIVLRGGKEAMHSNLALVTIMQESLKNVGLSENCITFIESADRSLAQSLMKDRQNIDVLIPRGSHRLIQSVIDEATVPVLETGVGNNHLYVHQDADIDQALKILVNAKCSRVSVCNALEKCLVDKTIVDAFIPKALELLKDNKIEVRVCEKLYPKYPYLTLATDVDWDTEYLDRIIAIKQVENMDEALNHIQRYGTKHSESIMTQSEEVAQRFLTEVDAAVVYHNASTRFTDGSEFGFGAEIGVSTQKLHARGPMGLDALTSYKYIVKGTGQIR